MKCHPVTNGVAAPVAVVVVTAWYVGVHGKAPAGRGRWVFQLGSKQSSVFYCGRGEYQAMKTAAVNEARALGLRRVEVRP